MHLHGTLHPPQEAYKIYCAVQPEFISKFLVMFTADLHRLISDSGAEPTGTSQINNAQWAQFILSDLPN